MANQTISLCMIAKNEEKNIANCLNSAKEIADEIIVVDTGSMDMTKQIANKFGAKVFDFKWNDDFSKARNESIKNATKDWILVLDADEVLDEEGIKEIKSLVESKDADGYLGAQINYTNDSNIAGFMPAIDKRLNNGYKGFYVSLIARLFRNKKNYHFSGAVHELVEDSIKKTNGKILVSNVKIHHYGNVEPEAAAGKKKYYLELAKKKANELQSADSYYELGVLLKENGNEKEAAEAFNRAIKSDKSHRMALYELGIAFEKAKDYDNAIIYYTRMLRIKDDAEGFFSLGVCSLKKGMLKEAKRNLTKSLLLNAYKVATYNNLGAVNEKMGNYQEAVNVLEIGMKIDPSNSIGAYNLGVAYGKMGNAKMALESFEKAVELGHKDSSRIKEMIKELKAISENMPTYRFSVGQK